MFVVELVEGKDHPCQAGPLDFEYLGGNTVGLLLHMMESYFSSGGYVIIDSGFYVFKGFIQLRKKGRMDLMSLKALSIWELVSQCLL